MPERQENFDPAVNSTKDGEAKYDVNSAEIFEPRFPDVVDSTMLATYDACPRRFFNEFILCLSGQVLSVDLHAGAAFAAGIEAGRTAYWFEGLSSSQAVERAYLTFVRYWGDYESPPNHVKSFTNMACALFDYFREYPLDRDPIRPYMMAGDRPAVEFTFALPLPFLHPETGQPLLYGGRVDLVGYYNAFCCTVDEKTTKSIGTTWANKWNMRGQFIGYNWACLEHGIPVQGALVRGIAIQKTQFGHLQAIVPIDKWRIEHWRENMLMRVQRMLCDYRDYKLGVKHAWNYSYGDACESYGGCQFAQNLCTTRDETIWYDSFKRRRWNPLLRDPVAEARLAEAAAPHMSDVAPGDEFLSSIAPKGASPAEEMFLP